MVVATSFIHVMQTTAIFSDVVHITGTNYAHLLTSSCDYSFAGNYDHPFGMTITMIGGLSGDSSHYWAVVVPVDEKECLCNQGMFMYFTR